MSMIFENNVTNNYGKTERGNMMRNIINFHKEAGTKKDAVKMRQENDMFPNKPNRFN